MNRRGSHGVRRICAAVVCAGVIAAAYMTLPLPWYWSLVIGVQICFAVFFAAHALQERGHIVSLYNEGLLDLPPEVASRFVEDMRAFLIEKDPFKRDEIATRQLHALRQFQRPREKELCLADIRQIFLASKDQE